MALNIVLKTAPNVEPVTLIEAKLHLRVDGDEEDTLINSLIVAAREHCEKISNRAYITQTWQLWLDYFPAGNIILLPRPPLKSVTSIKYYGNDSTEATMSDADYFVDTASEPGRLVLAHGASWPNVSLRPVNGVCVEYICGYGSVPNDIKQSVLMLVAHWYENREVAGVGNLSKEIDFAVRSLLRTDRVIPI